MPVELPPADESILDLDECPVDVVAPQQGRERDLIDAKYHAGIPHITKLDGKAQPVRGAAMLSYEGQVGFREGVMPNQFILGIWHRQQVIAVGHRENGAARQQRSSDKKKSEQRKRRS